MSSNFVNSGEMNSNSIVNTDIKGSKNINGDNNIITITNKFNSKIPKRLNDKERREKEKSTYRPCFKDKLNQKITCFGYIIGKHKRMKNLYTVINIVDTNGKYVADYIQLDLKENEYDYTNDYSIGNYVRFTGIVDKYVRKDGSIDYSVNIIKKANIFSEDYDLFGQPYDYLNTKINVQKLDEYIAQQNISKIYDLIYKIRKEVNDITQGFYFEDYLYYFIINQFTLNTSTYAIYEGDLRDQNMNEDCAVGILLLLGSLLFELKTKEYTNLRKLMMNIVMECNVLQGINKYTNYEDNPNFKIFYEQYLSKNNQSVGKKKLEVAFNFIFKRCLNFGNKPYDKNELNDEIIKERAYCMIQELI